MEAMDVKYKTVLFPNGGAAKKVKPAAVAPAVVGEPMYRECLKNHAASLGGHALDGCGEFMPSAGANAADPSSLRCAACGCHRNFHRRTVEGNLPPAALAPAPLALPAPVPAGVLHGQPPRREETPEDRLPAVVDGDDSDSDSDASEYDEERSLSPPPAQLHHVPAPVAQQPPPPPTYFPSAPHMLLSLGSGAPGAAAAAAAAQRLPAHNQLMSTPSSGGPAPRKRFRTKFTAEQKQRMQELSERLGWRLQKRDEAVVDEWCRDIGVGKGVFKVWMHNNKHNFLGGHSARRSASSSGGAPVSASAPPLHTPTAAGSAPPFHTSAASPPPPVLSSSPPAAAGFININGGAASAVGHQQENIINGSSSPQSA